MRCSVYWVVWLWFRRFQTGWIETLITLYAFKWNCNKGVSDLETCMDYFALPGRSCKKLNFPACVLMTCCWEKSSNLSKIILDKLTILVSIYQFWWLSCFGGKVQDKFNFNPRFNSYSLCLNTIHEIQILKLIYWLASLILMALAHAEQLSQYRKQRRR